MATPGTDIKQGKGQQTHIGKRKTNEEIEVDRKSVGQPVSKKLRTEKIPTGQWTRDTSLEITREPVKATADQEGKNYG